MSPTVTATIVAHATQTFPEECVGALLARGDDLVAALPLHNAALDRQRTFELSARDYLYAEHTAAAQGLTVCGYYHSHPHGPAQPSAHDEAMLPAGARGLIAARAPDGRFTFVEYTRVSGAAGSSPSR